MPSDSGNPGHHHRKHAAGGQDPPSTHQEREREREREQRKQKQLEQEQEQERLRQYHEDWHRTRIQEWHRRNKLVLQQMHYEKSIRKQIRDLQNKLAGSEIYRLGPGEQMERLKDQIEKEITTLEKHKETHQGIFDKNKWTKQERQMLKESIKSFEHRPSVHEQLLQDDPKARRATEGLTYFQREVDSNGAQTQKLLNKLIALRQGQD